MLVRLDIPILRFPRGTNQDCLIKHFQQVANMQSVRQHVSACLDGLSHHGNGFQPADSLDHSTENKSIDWALSFPPIHWLFSNTVCLRSAWSGGIHHHSPARSHLFLDVPVPRMVNRLCKQIHDVFVFLGVKNDFSLAT